MSHQRVDDYWKLDKSNMSPVEKLVLLYLSYVAGRDGLCLGISTKELSEKANANGRHIQRIVQRLKAKKLIKVLPNYRDDGGTGPNNYQVVF